jgi:hypothetical protein
MRFCLLLVCIDFVCSTSASLGSDSHEGELLLPKENERSYDGQQMCKYFGYEQDSLKLYKFFEPATSHVLVFNGTNPIVEKMFLKPPSKETTDKDLANSEVRFRRWGFGSSCGEVFAKIHENDKAYLIDVLLTVDNPRWTQKRGRMFFRKGHCAHTSDKKKYTAEVVDRDLTSIEAHTNLDDAIKDLVSKAQGHFEKHKLIPYMVVVTDLSQQEQSRKISVGGVVGNTLKVIGGVVGAIGSIGRIGR